VKLPQSAAPGPAGAHQRTSIADASGPGEGIAITELIGIGSQGEHHHRRGVGGGQGVKSLSIVKSRRGEAVQGQNAQV
jgi:hypothetical protein